MSVDRGVEQGVDQPFDPDLVAVCLFTLIGLALSVRALLELAATPELICLL